MFTDLRLKILHFIKKNKKVVFIVICIWAVVFFINMFLKNYHPKPKLQTTYTPHQSVMDTKSKVPTRTSNEIEDKIDEYMGYCNAANWAEAYNMLSDTCKEIIFDNSLDNFMDYAYKKMPTEKKYAIQDFSNDGNTYIYQIKYADDMLATGLTNTTYQFTEEKIVFKKKKNGKLEMAVGNFVDYGDIKNVFENDYLKVDVKSVVKYYSIEEYVVKITNRTDDTIVIADGAEGKEVLLNLVSSDTRERMNIDNDIVLGPKKSTTVRLKFEKFYDNDDDAKSMIFNSVRVMEHYSGTENVSDEVIQAEIQNAIAKFSVTVPVTYKD